VPMRAHLKVQATWTEKVHSSGSSACGKRARGGRLPDSGLKVFFNDHVRKEQYLGNARTGISPVED
jgi:hypothetical protein